MASPHVELDSVLRSLGKHLPTLLGYAQTQTFNLYHELTEENFVHRSYSNRRLALGAKHLAEELEKHAEYIREQARVLREVERGLEEAGEGFYPRFPKEASDD